MIPIWLFSIVVQKGSGSIKSKFFEQGLNNLSLDEKSKGAESPKGMLLPPPPPAPLSPAASPEKSPIESPTNLSLEKSSQAKASESIKDQRTDSKSPENENTQDIPDDDFGDFQAAG